MEMRTRAASQLARRAPPHLHTNSIQILLLSE